MNTCSCPKCKLMEEICTAIPAAKHYVFGIMKMSSRPLKDYKVAMPDEVNDILAAESLDFHLTIADFYRWRVRLT